MSVFIRSTHILSAILISVLISLVSEARFLAENSDFEKYDVPTAMTINNIFSLDVTPGSLPSKISISLCQTTSQIFLKTVFFILHLYLVRKSNV
jgi:hypothetical protein